MRRSQAATRRRARRWLGGFAGAALLGSTVIVSPIIVSPAAADEADADLARFYGQTVTWGPCDDVAGGSECGTVAVPMDYRNPSGRTLDLAVLRILASGNARGSLLVNPGGPGAGGVDFAEYLSTVIDSDVRAVYDIVGFDPRGVGQSAPVTCLTDKQILRWNRTDITPDTARERRTLFSRADRISQGCLDRDPALARSVGTANTVRDMDILRRVLGDDELNWFGFSYGTELGALYAQRFPDRVGRMVLDGAVDPSLNAMEVSEDQSAGFPTSPSPLRLGLRATLELHSDNAGRSALGHQPTTRATRPVTTVIGWQPTPRPSRGPHRCVLLDVFDRSVADAAFGTEPSARRRRFDSAVARTIGE